MFQARSPTHRFDQFDPLASMSLQPRFTTERPPCFFVPVPERYSAPCQRPSAGPSLQLRTDSAWRSGQTHAPTFGSDMANGGHVESLSVGTNRYHSRFQGAASSSGTIPPQPLPQHLHTPQVQTSSFTSTSTADLDSSAFWSRLHAAGLLGANTVDAGTAPSREFPNLVWQTWYRCDYCGIAKASTSGVKNGRTRIRCQCGGTRQDGVLRLHQQWSVTFEDTSKIRRPTECYTQRPQFCIDTHDVQSSRSHQMKRKPAQPLQAQPSQSATQSNVKCVSQRVPHPTTEKSVPRLPPPPEPRHLLEPAASTERQCANKPAVMQQELFVIRKMLSEEVSEPQQAVPYKALTAPSEEQRSKAIKRSFDTSAEIQTDASSCESVSEHPAKRFKPLSRVSMGSSLCDAVTKATSAIAATLLDSNSTAMLSVDDELEDRPTAALDLLATVSTCFCHPDECNNL